MPHLKLAPILALLLALIAVATHVPAALALTCVPFSAERSVERSDVVLVGTVHSIDVNHASKAEIAVDRYLKGSGQALVTFESVTMSWAGGWSEDQIGQEWLFFLEVEGNAFLEPACSGSHPLDGKYGDPASIQEVEALTGEGSPPAPNEAQENPGQADNRERAGLSLVWGAGIALLVVGISGLGVAYRWSRGRRS